MKAAQINKYGGPDVTRLADLPLPVPGAGQLRVRVRVAGVGPWDALVREGGSGVSQTLPLILGSDIAGVVDAIGPGVSHSVPETRFTASRTAISLAATPSIP
jgi:NADPH:quinone reductase-like Zn-dependent oxidoreductase